MTILDEILAHKREELARARLGLPPDEMAQRARAVSEPTRGFRAALVDAPAPRVIAELKRRSPSRGEIRPGFDPAACAAAYAEAGAAAISVLTETPHFGGELADLSRARAAAPVPLLRKDFLVDAYQIDEARVAGADAVLLIVAAFTGAGGVPALAALRDRAVSLGLDVLVEVHDERELADAVAAGADLIGVNNRDLRTFEVDLEVTERVAKLAPDGVFLVAESGISDPRDVARLTAAGAGAFLVGEALMREPDVGLALQRLRRTS